MDDALDLFADLLIVYGYMSLAFTLFVCLIGILNYLRYEAKNEQEEEGGGAI